MFQFSCSFFFYHSTFRLSNRTPKIARILIQYQANAATLTLLSKEDKILIKSLQECKGYNARQSLWTKVGRRTASTGCWWSSEQSTGVWAAADAVRILMITSTQLSRCCWVRKTNLRAKRNFTWGGGGIRRSSVSQIIHKVLRLKCYKKRRAQQLTEGHSMHALFSVCSLRDQ